MKVIPLTLLLFGLTWAERKCNCGWGNEGGTEVQGKIYPWMVAVKRLENNATICGGVIITHWHILTAASCVRKPWDHDLAVLVGAHDLPSLSENSKLYTVEKYILHPSYSYIRGTNDIAVLETSTKIEFNEFVGPVCMPSKQIGDEMNNQPIKLTGWGKYDPSNPILETKEIKELGLKIISHQKCKVPNAALICTIFSRQKVCTGDSGDPLTWVNPETNRTALVGIISNGAIKCGSFIRPASNTDVSGYLSWIDQQILDSKREAKTCHNV